MEIWKNSELIYQGKIVNLRTGTVSLQDGRTAFREVVEHPGGVCIAVLDGDEVILVKQFRIAINKEILEAPAGKIEPGDDPIERGRKELEEETGYRARRFEYLGSAYSSVGYCSELIYFYLARDLEYIGAKPDVDEELQLVRVKLDEVRWMLNHFKFEDSKTYIAMQALVYKIDNEKE